MFGTRLFSAPCRSARSGDCPAALAQVRAAYTRLQRQREEFAQKQVIDYAAKLDFGSARGQRRGAPGSSFLCPGDQRLKKIEWLVHNMGISLTDDQIEFVTAFINGLLPHIYGKEEWPSVEYRVLKERGLEKIEPLLLCFAKRRIGKTWIIAIMSAAVITTLRGFEETIFSTGGRISGKMVSAIRNFINRIEGGAQRCHVSSEQLYVIPASIMQVIGGKHGFRFEDNVSVINA
jgi:hypothetical protein